LDAVVTQMPEWIVELRDVVVLPTYSEIGIFKDINLQWLNGGNKHPLSDVKLSIVKLFLQMSHIFEEKRPLDVFLNHFWSWSFFAESIDDFLFVIKAEYSKTPSVVARFAYPHIIIPVDRLVLGPVLFKLGMNLES
jgi:hypothetical protein